MKTCYGYVTITFKELGKKNYYILDIKMFSRELLFYYDIVFSHLDVIKLNLIL